MPVFRLKFSYPFYILSKASVPTYLWEITQSRGVAPVSNTFISHRPSRLHLRTGKSDWVKQWSWNWANRNCNILESLSTIFCEVYKSLSCPFPQVSMSQSHSLIFICLFFSPLNLKFLVLCCIVEIIKNYAVGMGI